MMNEKGLLSLPPSVFGEILKYVDVRSAQIVGKTCKLAHKLVRQEVVWEVRSVFYFPSFLDFHVPSQNWMDFFMMAQSIRMPFCSYFTKNDAFRRVFIHHIRAGHLQALKEAAQKLPGEFNDPKMQSVTGYTGASMGSPQLVSTSYCPVGTAIHCEKLEILKWMVSNGADLEKFVAEEWHTYITGWESADKEDGTRIVSPLEVAITTGNPKILKYVVETLGETKKKEFQIKDQKFLAQIYPKLSAKAKTALRPYFKKPPVKKN